MSFEVILHLVGHRAVDRAFRLLQLVGNLAHRRLAGPHAFDGEKEGNPPRRAVNSHPVEPGEDDRHGAARQYAGRRARRRARLQSCGSAFSARSASPTPPPASPCSSSSSRRCCPRPTRWLPDEVALFVAPLMRFTIAMLQPVHENDRADRPPNPQNSRRRSATTSTTSSLHTRSCAAQSSSAQKEGSVARGDADMLGGVLDLRDLQVLDIMVHRTKMDTINSDDPPEKVLDEVLKRAIHANPIVEGRAREHRRGAAYQGPAGRAAAAPTGTFPSSTS